MSNIQETYNQLTELIETFTENHQKNVDGNKAAGGRARKAASEIKKVLTSYRKESIEASKA